MSGALGNLLIKLTADTGEATGDIGKAAHQIERDMQTMATKAAAAGALIGNVMGDVAVAIGRAAKDAVMFGDQMQKMSQRTGMAVGRLSEIAFASDLADVSIGQVSAGLAQFNKALVDADKDGGKAQQMFEALGVSVKDGPQVAFEQMAVAINSLPDGELKAAAMRAAFGKAGDALIPMMSGLDDATEKARRLGLTLSEQMARDSEKFNDAMTTLGAGLSALVRNSLSGTVSVLAEMSNQLVNAAGKGQFLTGVLFELGRVGAATLGGIAAIFGDEKAVDQAAAAFASMTIKPDGGTPSPAAAPKVDQAALRAAISRSGTSRGGKAKGGKDDNLAGRQWQEWMDEEAKIMAEAAAATDKYNQTLRDMEAAEQAAMIAGEVARAEAILQMDEILNKQVLLANGWDENGKAIADNAKKTTDWAREMGLTFSSAFEDAIIKGGKFSDVLRGIGQDLLRIAARKSVTEPLGKMAGGAIDKGLDWLIKQLPSYDVGTDYVPQDTLAMVHKGEAIIPASQNSGNRGGTYYIDARGADRSGMDNLLAYIRSVDGSIEQRAVSAVSETRRRGGSFARSMG